MKDFELEKKIEFLKSFALFAELSNSELTGLAHVMKEVELEPGHGLLKQNEPADAVYFLKSGAVKVLVNDEKVAQIDQIQCFGEMSCLTPNTPASATVITAKKSQLYRIAKTDFLNSVGQITKLWQMLFVQMSERVRTTNGRLSEILLHLPQGLMKVSPEGIVSNDYSAQCTKFFKRENIAGFSFAKLAFPNDEAKQKSWQENLGLLFSETNMSFESCASLLANKFSLAHDDETSHFTMSYYPCKSLSGKIIAVDIGIQDITKEIELERKHRETKQKEEILNKITQSPDSYVNFLALSEEVYTDTVDFFSQLKSVGAESVESRVEQLMRRLHSLKGISGVFSLQGFKSVAHEAETIVSQIKASGDDAAKVASVLEKKLAEFKTEKDRAHNMFSEMPADLRRRLVGIVFSPHEFVTMKDLIEKSDWAGIQKLLASVEKIDSKKLIAQWAQETQKLADTLGKQVQFNMAGEGGRIAKDLFAQLDKVLIHLLRNGIDHGLESPEERTEKGKSPQGRITAMIDVSETELMMAIEDDGRGIDREALVNRARQNTSFDQKLIDSYVAKGEEWKILLLPGFSTAKEVTDISGRGVGLDAVAKAISCMNGTLTIESNFGEGTCFMITVPVAG